jgi:hypothetical protein
VEVSYHHSNLSALIINIATFINSYIFTPGFILLLSIRQVSLMLKLKAELEPKLTPKLELKPESKLKPIPFLVIGTITIIFPILVTLILIVHF